MSLSIVVVICFVGIALFVGAVCMLIRDLVFSGTAETESLVDRSRMLRRTAKAAAAKPNTLGDRIDQGFDRLVLESGAPMSSLSAALACVASGLVVGGLFFMVREELGPALILAAVGMAIPLVWLSIKRGRRIRQIREEIPQLLDLLSRSARAGRSLEQSLQLASQELRGVLGAELGACAKQLDMGRSFGSVMKSLAGRLRLLEIRILATTLMVQRTSGGNLPETLDRMSTVVRDRLFARKRMKAATSAGRTSAILIAAICPLAYAVMFIVQPEHVGVLLTDSLGQTLLMVAAVLELVGVFWVVSLLKQQ